MTCTTCGRENPPHLTFCQECGQRLGPRIAPPTPPIGLSGGGGDVAAEPARVQTQLGGAVKAQAATPGASVQPPPLTTGPKRCRVCDTVNSAGLRYCTSCGSTLEAAGAVSSLATSHAPSHTPSHAATIAEPAPPMAIPMPNPAPSPSPALELVPSPAAAFAAAPAPIAPMRVVDLGSAAAAAPRACPRCRGVADPGAQFCKFCGASLIEGEGRPSPSRPMQAAAPPLLPHERLALAPGANGGGAGGARPMAAPMQHAARPVPSASPIAPAASPPPAPIASAPAPERAPPSVARGPTRGPTRGRLVVIAKSGADGPSYPIGDTIDVGRLEGHVVVGEDPYLSPRHVRVTFAGGKLVLRDLASTNGVYLRLSRARDMRPGGSPSEVAVPLEDQDLILVGQQVLRFEVVKDAESGLGPAVEHGTLLFGSPAAPRYARLGQRTVEGVTRDVYYVRKVETVLGRESGDVVFTEDPFLSRRHAAIRVLDLPSGGGGGGKGAGAGGAGLSFALLDLGSSNGSFLRIRGDVELVQGDHFRVGQQLFRVDFEDGGRAA